MYIIHKLFTKEDPFYLHKTLGLISISNFAYRFYSLFTQGSMQMNTTFDVSLLYVHAGLSISSLIYHIPLKRHSRLPMIYPEFRLHSIIFALRSILCCFIDFYIVQYKLYCKMAICILTMMGADYITNMYSDVNNANTTMRSMPFDEAITEIQQKKITMFYTLQQISATLFMLNNIESTFGPLFAIQIAAFLMTLVRKGIITPNTWHLVYSFSLIINIFVLNTYNTTQFVYVFFGTQYIKILRLKLRLNKYLCWGSLFIIYSYVNIPHLAYQSSINTYFIRLYLIVQIYILRSLYLKLNVKNIVDR